MIKVEIRTALLLYLALFLLLYLGSWIFSHLRQRNKVALPPLYFLSTCEYCHYHYLGRTGEKITKCPQCGSFNKNGEC